MFLSIQLGFVDAADIVFLILFGYFCVYSVTKTGATYGAINVMLKKLNGREKVLLPLFMVIFAIAGSTYGEIDTVRALMPLMVGLCIAIGYDGIVGMAITMLAVNTGFASATTNPFTIGIAQSIAELPINSGLLYRVIIFAVFITLTVMYTMRYANKIKNDPSKSLVKDVDFRSLKMDREEVENSQFTLRHKIIMLVLLATIVFIVYSTLALGWYINEMSAIFLLSGVIVSIIGGFKPDEIAKNLLDSCSDMLIGAITVGMARAILVILRQGNIIDTIVYYLYIPLKNLPSWLAAEGMLVVQNLINFFIPSGSGQATAIMPIMVPLSDLVHVNRQVAVLAYQMGDGYSNLLWPTSVVTSCAIAKVPVDKWYKFYIPLFGIMFVLQTFFVIAGQLMNYGPF